MHLMKVPSSGRVLNLALVTDAGWVDEVSYRPGGERVAEQVYRLNFAAPAFVYMRQAWAGTTRWVDLKGPDAEAVASYLQKLSVAPPPAARTKTTPDGETRR